MDRAGAARQDKWPTWRDALELAHKGDHAAARDRLAYDELLANSLALMLVQEGQPQAARAAAGGRRIAARQAAATAVPADRRAAALDCGDRGRHGAGAPMLRLLQGDVGSGKTVVALEAMLMAVEAGRRPRCSPRPRSSPASIYETSCRMAADRRGRSRC
jgi:ATP-dependent DNA helicase RecG